MNARPSETLLEEVDSAVDEQRLVDTLRTLIGLHSENPFDEPPTEGQGEEAVARYVASRLENIGVRCDLREIAPGRYNAVATLGAAAEANSLMLAGHTDTVGSANYPGAYDANVRDGRVYGRGACDMKGALACYLEVAEVLRGLGGPSGTLLRGTLHLAFVADEEYKMEGAQEIGRAGPRTDGVIVGEGTNLGVCPASKGRVSTFVVTQGKAAHASAPERGVNAISHMGRVLVALEDYAEELLRRDNPHPLLGKPRINAGVIRGGVQVNTVPDECRLEVDRRTLPSETKEDVYKELERLLGGVGSETPSFRAYLTEPSWLVPANETASDHPLVGALRRSVEEVTGRDPDVEGYVGGSDAAHFGSPAVICGPGSVEQAHTNDEWVAVEELSAASRVYLRTVLGLLG